METTTETNEATTTETEAGDDAERLYSFRLRSKIVTNAFAQLLDVCRAECLEDYTTDAEEAAMLEASCRIARAALRRIEDELAADVRHSIAWHREQGEAFARLLGKMESGELENIDPDAVAIVDEDDEEPASGGEEAADAAARRQFERDLESQRESDRRLQEGFGQG